jgi:Fur family transcriptional regulator, peroxide stress response regulator
MPATEGGTGTDTTLIADRLRSMGLKATPQRILILKELQGRKDHPSAESLYRTVKETQPSLSFNTVYQTLQALNEKEVINVIRPVVDAARYDPITEIHGHFMCSKCKRIEDHLLEDPTLKKMDSDVSNAGKYWIVQRQILWVGLCQDCQESEQRIPEEDKT